MYACMCNISLPAHSNEHHGVMLFILSTSISQRFPQRAQLLCSLGFGSFGGIGEGFIVTLVILVLLLSMKLYVRVLFVGRDFAPCDYLIWSPTTILVDVPFPSRAKIPMCYSDSNFIKYLSKRKYCVNDDWL